jgi:hypothetical protein
MSTKICKPNRKVSYSAWLFVQTYSKWTDVLKTRLLGEIKTIKLAIPPVACSDLYAK